MTAFLIALMTALGVVQVQGPITPVPVCPSRFHYTADKSPTRVDRREWAKSLAMPFEALLRSLPEPAPRERDWLDGEFRAGGSRLVVASFSTIGRQVILRDLSTDITSTLRSIDSQIDERAEMARWGYLVIALTDRELAGSILHLVEQKLLSEGFAAAPQNLSRVDFLDHSCRNQARQIQEKIVLPYLEKLAR